MNEISYSKLPSNWIDTISFTIEEAVNPIFQKMFEGVHNALFSGMGASIFVTYCILWTLRQTQNGYIAREELFNGIKWITYFAILTAIMSSYEAYQIILSWLNIPMLWVKSATISIFDTNKLTFGEMITNSFNELNFLAVKLFNFGLEKWKDEFAIGFGWLAYVVVGAGLGWFWIFYALFIVMVIIVIVIVLNSSLISFVILSLACLTIPLLFSKITQPYFFSWLKLYISYSLYAPASFIILYFLNAPLDRITNLVKAGAIEEIYDNTMINFLIPILLCILLIGFFKKIPNIISQILGISGLENSSGLFGGLGKAVAMGIATFAGGAIGAKIAGASMGGALKSGAINATPGARTIQSFKEKYKEANMKKNTIAEAG
ncbi:hypothetical protein FTT16_08450 [Campylobacter jejuni]|nr:hypothetical protein [Campylobacter jejuni]